MSHNVTLKGVKFSDLDLLRAAVEELRSEGTGMQLVTEKTTIKDYYGKTTQVDMAVKFNSGFDIGFNYNAEEGCYTPVLENMFNQPGVSSLPTDLTVDGRACGYRAEHGLIGRLSQRYAVLHTEVNAARQGISTRRINDAATGQIHLEATQA